MASLDKILRPARSDAQAASATAAALTDICNQLRDDIDSGMEQAEALTIAARACRDTFPESMRGAAISVAKETINANFNSKRLVENVFKLEWPLEQERKQGTAPLKSWREGTITAADLVKKDFRPVRFIVQGIFAEGLNLLVARPKLGKSWLALDLALAVAGDGEVLGDTEPARGDVLGLFLEDNQRRLKSRIEKLIGRGEAAPERLTLKTEWRLFDAGGLDDISEWCKAVDNPTLLVIDTLARVRPPAGRSKASAYEQDTAALAGLHKVALDHGVCVLLIHHTRKMESDDPFDTISGTQGLGGVADTNVVLKKQATATVLYVRGRDVEETEIAVSFDTASCRWKVLGSAADVMRSDERSKIIETLISANQPMRAKEIYHAAEMRSLNATEKLISKMIRDGEIERVKPGLYTVTGQRGQSFRNTDRTDHPSRTEQVVSSERSTDTPPWRRVSRES